MKFHFEPVCASPYSYISEQNRKTNVSEHYQKHFIPFSFQKSRGHVTNISNCSYSYMSLFVSKLLGVISLLFKTFDVFWDPCALVGIFGITSILDPLDQNKPESICIIVETLSFHLLCFF